MPTVSSFSHVTLTVTDLEKSVAWYEKALGLKRLRDMEGPGWKRVLMLGDNSAMIALQSHDSTAKTDRFDETRVGLDHLSIGCKDRAEVQAWATALEAAGTKPSDIHGDPASVMTAQDPDGIAIEFFAPPAN